MAEHTRFVVSVLSALSLAVTLSACSDSAGSQTLSSSSSASGSGGGSGSGASSGSGLGSGSGTSSGSGSGTGSGSTGSSTSSGGSGSSGGGVDAGSSSGGNSYGLDDPGLVSIFDGTTLGGWTQRNPGGWVVTNGVIHGTGTAGRGFLYTDQMYSSFRWIFTLRHVTGGHAPCVLVWGVSVTLDAMGAIQFQPPSGGSWDYRPGENNSGAAFFTHLPHPPLDSAMWDQCELLADGTKGTARMACCTIPAGGARCKGAIVLDFKDPAWTNKSSPIALQVHSGGLIDEYKDLYVETNPTQDALITTQ